MDLNTTGLSVRVASDHLLSLPQITCLFLFFFHPIEHTVLQLELRIIIMMSSFFSKIPLVSPLKLFFLFLFVIIEC